MTINEAEQIARIICNVFEHEESVDPRTVARMFQYMGRMKNPIYESEGDTHEV